MKKQVTYFFGSIRGEKSEASIRNALVSYLRGYGEVITEHFEPHSLNDRQIYMRDMRNIERSTVLVGEVTAATTGGGFEIGRVVERNIQADERFGIIRPILCLYRTSPEKTSAIITGCREGSFTSKKYENLDEAFVHIDSFFRSL